MGAAYFIEGVGVGPGIIAALGTELVNCGLEQFQALMPFAVPDKAAAQDRLGFGQGLPHFFPVVMLGADSFEGGFIGFEGVLEVGGVLGVFVAAGEGDAQLVLGVDVVGGGGVGVGPF